MSRNHQWYKKRNIPLHDDQGRAALVPFSPGDFRHPHFDYVRYDWIAEGPRCGISQKVRAKLEPSGHTAYHHEILLPESAPSACKRVEEWLRCYDGAVPGTEIYAYAQFTPKFDAATPLPRAWNQVRAWAEAEFVERFGVSVLLVHHLPALAGSPNRQHVHALIPLRQLDQNGFGAHVKGIGSDAGAEAALASWLAASGRNKAPSLQ